MAGGQLPFGFAPQGELTAYTPTLREKAADWLRQKLFTDDREGQDKANRLVNVGETMLPPFGFATMAYDAGRAGGQGDYLTAGALGAMAVLPGGSKRGIKAYHGSPHSFDKFSMDKIGTGEGAQAYGHGLYFAENEGVAKGYRDTLTKSSTDGAQTRLKKAGGDVDAAIADLQGRIANYRDNGAPQYADAIEEDLRALVKFKETGEWTPGSMYEVNIDADPNAFLDWDKPLSEQPEAVRKSFGDLVGRDLSKETGWAKMNGQQALDAIMERYGSLDWPDDANAALRAQYRDNSRSKASAILAGKGIPGIKYLDAGSRPSTPANQMIAEFGSREKALEVAQQRLANARDHRTRINAEDLVSELSRSESRNYVVFDDKLISIVKKYGIAGASAMLGYNILDGVTNAQAEQLKKAESK
jgi:hypothetical protein